MASKKVAESVESVKSEKRVDAREKKAASPSAHPEKKAASPSAHQANGYKEGDEVIFGYPKGQQTRGTFSHRTAQGKLTIRTLEPRGQKKTWPAGTVVHWPPENVRRA